MAENRSEMRLFDPRGNRLYLDAEERQAFLAAAREQERTETLRGPLQERIILHVAFLGLPVGPIGL